MYVAVLIGDNYKVMPPIQFDSALGIMRRALTNSNDLFLVFEGANDNATRFYDEASKMAYAIELKDKFIQDVINKSKNFEMVYDTEKSTYKPRTVTIARVAEQLKASGFQSSISIAKLIEHVKINRSSITLKGYTFSSDGQNLYDNSLTQEDLMMSDDLDDSVEEARDPSGLEVHGLKVTASINPMRSPSVRRMPPNISNNIAAHKLWQWVIKNFKVLLVNEPDFKRRWAIAVIIYKRAAIKHGLKPFADHAQYKDDIRFKLDKDNSDVDDLIDVITKESLENRLVKEVSNEIYETTMFKNAVFCIVTRRRIYLDPNVSLSDYSNFLRENFRFVRRGRISVHGFSSRTDLSIEEFEGNVYFKTYHRIYKNEVLPLVQPLTPTSNEEIIGAIHQLMRVWFSTGHLRFRKKDIK